MRYRIELDDSYIDLLAREYLARGYYWSSLSLFYDNKFTLDAAVQEYKKIVADKETWATVEEWVSYPAIYGKILNAIHSRAIDIVNNAIKRDNISSQKKVAQ